MNKVFIISGPPAVGKSTVSKLIANSLPKSALISADQVHHMIIGGHLAPWKNIAELTKNYLDFGLDVVIDAVAFPIKVEYLKEEIGRKDVTTKYVILFADKISLLTRDGERIESMGERCLELLEEFRPLNPKPRNYLDTTSKSPEQIAGEILSDNQDFFTEWD